jgi:hypothetical protein
MKRKTGEMTDAKIEPLLKKLQRIKPAHLTLDVWLKRMEIYLASGGRPPSKYPDEA